MLPVTGCQLPVTIPTLATGNRQPGTHGRSRHNGPSLHHGTRAFGGDAPPRRGASGQGLQRPPGGARRFSRHPPGRNRRTPRSQRRRKDDHVLHDRRARSSRRRTRDPGERRHHRAADVSARTARHQLSAAGAVRFSQIDGRRKSAVGLRNDGSAARGAGSAHAGAAGRIWDHTHRPQSCILALRRRAETRGNCARSSN